MVSPVQKSDPYCPLSVNDGRKASSLSLDLFVPKCQVSSKTTRVSASQFGREHAISSSNFCTQKVQIRTMFWNLGCCSCRWQRTWCFLFNSSIDRLSNAHPVTSVTNFHPLSAYYNKKLLMSFSNFFVPPRLRTIYQDFLRYKFVGNLDDTIP